ncbi:shikimate kinase [Gordonia paraffinivorans]|uniref:Shikimate kinase n=1 Tax=Gordonia paraffinivorans TaxID=175628 RepID=A0ABD7UZQ0_9ACTN|nr:shikimate kinase [Gordonia paraffinivorans]MCD2144371.1 shikimate kinase [Gordonia paraffinivorans]VFA82137.1 Shikimate kinase [Gordonia paraffinivorans]
MTGSPTPTRPTAGKRPAAVLIGFMGAGKSTVGRLLADRLDVDFVDTDVELVRRTGRSIPEIFETDGVDGFRTIEENVVTDVLEHHGGVVSLGGGAVTTPGVRDALSGHRVVYLRVSPDRGFERVSGTDRPLLATADPAARYAELLAERTDIYSSVCTLEVDADAEPEAIADAIVSELARELDVTTPEA